MNQEISFCLKCIWKEFKLVLSKTYLKNTKLLYQYG